MYKSMSLILLLLCWASPAMAQSQLEQMDKNQKTALALITTAPLAISSSIGYLSAKMYEIGLQEEIDHLKILVLQRFLDENERQVRLALVLGEGESLRDIVSLIDSNTPFTNKLGKQLRQKRHHFWSVLKQPKTYARAEMMYKVVYGVMKQQTTHSTILLLNEGGQQ